MENMINTTIKILLIGLAFFFGTMLGGMVAPLLGFASPAMPEGSDPGALALVLLLASLGMGALLAFLNRRVDGSRAARWAIVGSFGWVVYSLSTLLEASIFTTFSSASPAKLVMDLAAFAAAAGLAARLFEPRPGRHAREAGLFERGWPWRLALAWAAFPVIYLAFGKLVEPLVIHVYREGLLEMTAPTWGQIIPMQLLRSALLLAAILPVILRWNRSPRALWLGLAGAFFLLTGGFYMLQAYWMPAGFRLAHSLEMLADALAYTGLLAALFRGRLTGERRAAGLQTAL